MSVHFVKGRYVNSYVIEEGEKLFVIDVAMRGGEKFVLGYVEQVMGRSVKDIELVVCTHDDPDHIGGVHALAKVCHAQVAMPFASNSLLLKNLNNPLGVVVAPATILIESFRPRMWSMYMNPNRSAAAEDRPTTQAADIEMLDEPENDPRSEGGMGKSADFLLYHKMLVPGFEDWQVLHTPGHSWDSMCFYHIPSRELIGNILCAQGRSRGS